MTEKGRCMTSPWRGSMARLRRRAKPGALTPPPTGPIARRSQETPLVLPGLHAPAPPLSANLRGGLWMLVSVAGATGMTVFVRIASTEMTTPMVAFLRSALGLLFLAPLLLRASPTAGLAMRRPWLHGLRGALIAVALNCGFYAVAVLPVATATILFFLAPIFATALAPVMVGETVGVRRWSAIGVGFLGALVVLRPGAQPIDAGVVAAGVSSLCFATALLIGKTMSAEDGSDAVFASSTVLAAVFTLPPALLFWRLPTEVWLWGALMALAAASALRGYADIRAMAAGEASFVAPISYLRLPAVGLAGWLLFDEAVDAWTWGGGAVIAAATLYIVLREARLKRSRGGVAP
ncbi:MAG: DMT family transporter [Rhodobacteraceae bacterium]|nr:MAG: DMT family transporter [Paracoccaceae bacterium]